MRYLTAQDILVIHALILDETGGSHGVREIGLLQSLMMRPQIMVGGKEAFPNVHLKAAAYLESLARYHVFVDGNKRTAFVTAARFLAKNGYELTLTNKEAEKYVISVVVEKPDIEAIALWLKRHSKKTKLAHERHVKS